MQTLATHLATFGARPPLPADAPMLARLYASTRPDLAGSADPALASALVAMHQRMQAADYRARFPTAEQLLLHAQGASSPVARIVLATLSERLHLVDIALLPEARGQGLGSAILAALQDWAARCQLPLTLSVQRANEHARRLYHARGFAIESVDGAAERWRWQPGAPRSFDSGQYSTKV